MLVSISSQHYTLVVEEDKVNQIVAMTANAMEGDRQRCLDAGMDDYAAKPIQRYELYDLIGKYLDGAILA